MPIAREPSCRVPQKGQRGHMTQQTETHAKLVVDDEFKVGPVHDRVFGSFVEHLGRCVYTGIYELMEAVNLGTRGLAEALDLLEYANVPNGTARSKERIRNGAKAPLHPPHVVLGQRDGRPVANGTQKRRGLRQARSLGRGRHAHDRPGPRAGGLRFVEPHDGHVRQVGRDRARTHLRQSELRIRAPSPSTARSASTAPSRIPKPTASSSSTRSSHSARSFRSPRTSSSAMNRRRAA